MEYIFSFIQKWGYVAVFLGSLVEGESVILTASSMAYLGHFSIYKIMVIAFFGTLIADQGLYMVGRRYGTGFLNRFTFLRVPAEKAFTLLKKYDTGFIIACRFIYGIRITSAIVIGASGILPSRFIPLNILSAFIWTVVSCLGGYFFGKLMMNFFENIEQVQKYILFFILFVTFFGVLVSFLKKRRSI